MKPKFRAKKLHRERVQRDYLQGLSALQLAALKLEYDKICPPVVAVPKSKPEIPLLDWDKLAGILDKYLMGDRDERSG